MHLPAFPAPLSRLAGRLPALPVSAAMSATLNLVAWPGLRTLDWSALQGRRFCVHVRDTGMRMYFSLGAHGFSPLALERAEVTFSATALDFARLALRLEDPDALFFDRRLFIEGDTELGLAAKNLLDSMDLSVLLGRLPFGATLFEKGQALLTRIAR